MNAIRSLLCALCLSVCTLAVTAQTVPPREDDQEWNEIQIIKPLSPTRDLIFTGQLRFGREFTHSVEEQLAVALAVKAHQHLTVTPAYSYVSQQPYKGRMINQHRLVLTVINRFTWRKWGLTERNQIEQRFVVANRDSFVYRQRVALDHPVQLGKFKCTPFIWDEIRYSSLKVTPQSRLGWFRNRLALGISKPLTAHSTLDIFYLRQNDGVSRPGNVNALGLTLRLTLPARKAATKKPQQS